jgi:hypothetical protein
LTCQRHAYNKGLEINPLKQAWDSLELAGGAAGKFEETFCCSLQGSSMIRSRGEVIRSYITSIGKVLLAQEEEDSTL